MTRRTFLITGATKGIGRAVANGLVSASQRVIGLAKHADSTFPEDLVTVDLSNATATSAALQTISGEHIDGVVNNVGVVRAQSLSEVSLRYLAAAPMARFASPSEIATAVAFLLSDAASYINGQTLFVDGGASIGKSHT